MAGKHSDLHKSGPFNMMLPLSSLIVQQKHYLKTPMPIQAEIIFYNEISTIAEKLDQMYTLSATPTPFNLCNIIRTMMFSLILSFPISQDEFRATLIPMVFFATYVVMGLDAVSSEIMDPYGDDPNDLDLKEYRDATLVYVQRILSRNTKGNFFYSVFLDDFFK